MASSELRAEAFGERLFGAEALIVHSDEEANRIVENYKNAFEAGAYDDIGPVARANAQLLLDTATRVGALHSFTANQTYPRISHPYDHLRKSPYFTFASILVSLRCTLDTEMKVSDNLMRAAPTDEDLLGMSIEEMAAIVRPAGFADRKAKWIVNGLHELATEERLSIETLTKDPLDTARAKLLALPGFGPKAADCFLLTGLNRASFPVDVNVFKLIVKLFPDMVVTTRPDFSNPSQVAAVKQFLEAIIPKDVQLYQIMHTYLLLATKHKIEV